MKANNRRELITDLEILKQRDANTIAELEKQLSILKRDRLSFIQLISNLRKEEK